MFSQVRVRPHPDPLAPCPFWPGQDGVPQARLEWVTPQPGQDGVPPGSVCLLRSRRRTVFLYSVFNTKGIANPKYVIKYLVNILSAGLIKICRLELSVLFAE